MHPSFRVPWLPHGVVRISRFRSFRVFAAKYRTWAWRLMKVPDSRATDLIAALTAIQEEHGSISPEALQALSERERVPLYHLHGLVTFYPHLRSEPLPGVEVAICTDLACHLRGAESLLRGVADAFEEMPGAKPE